MFEMERIYKLHQFTTLPWDSLDPDRCGRDWSIGRGGYGLGNETWTLSICQKDGSADVWELPPALGAVFEMLKESAANDALARVRAALGAH
jgi:hypothetical protein